MECIHRNELFFKRFHPVALLALVTLATKNLSYHPIGSENLTEPSIDKDSCCMLEHAVVLLIFCMERNHIGI